MIIKRVDIRDFRSHRRTEIDFGEGISVIVGDNGSGKTSILESINFALFKQKPNVNMDDLIRRGVDSTEVSVTFSANGRTYRAARGRKTGKAYGSSLYRIDGSEVLIVRGEDEITREIEEILGISGELFTSAVYIKQGEIDSLVSAQPSVRKEHVGKLLGADELERAHEGMRELMRGYESKKAELVSIPENIARTDAAIKEKDREIRVINEGLKKASEACSSVKSGLKEVQSSLKDLEKLRGIEIEIEKSDARLENLRENVQKIEEYEKELQKTQAFHERYAAAKKEIQSLADDRRELYELRERGEGLKRELLSAEKKAARLESEITAYFDEYGKALGKKFRDFQNISKYRRNMQDKLEANLGKVDNKIGNISSKISVAAGKNREIEKAVRELEKAGTKCPVCKGPLDKKHKKELLADYTEKIEKNLAKIEKWDSSLKTLAEKKEDIEESIRNVTGINIELLKSLIDEKKDLEKNVLKIKSEAEKNEKSLKGLSKIEKQISEKEKEKSGLEEGNERYIAAKSYLRRYLPEKEEFQNDIKEVEKRVSKLKRDVKKLGGPLDAKKFERMKLKEKELQEKYNTSQNEKTRLESQKGYERKELKELKQHLVELKSKEKELEKLSKFLLVLKDIRDLFHKDFLQRELRTKALPVIEAHTREIFDMFELPYTDLELTDDFNVILFTSHGEENVDMLSGGERIAAALALRIGIAKALSGSAMELIILDEPTIHLDSQRRQDLVEIIKRLSSIPQTIVVTHDKEFEHAADRLIVVEKTSGVSRVTESEKDYIS